MLRKNSRKSCLVSLVLLATGCAATRGKVVMETCLPSPAKPMWGCTQVSGTQIFRKHEEMHSKGFVAVPISDLADFKESCR